MEINESSGMWSPEFELEDGGIRLCNRGLVQQDEAKRTIGWDCPSLHLRWTTGFKWGRTTQKGEMKEVSGLTIGKIFAWFTQKRAELFLRSLRSMACFVQTELLLFIVPWWMDRRRPQQGWTRVRRAWVCIPDSLSGSSTAGYTQIDSWHKHTKK